MAADTGIEQPMRPPTCRSLMSDADYRSTLQQVATELAQCRRLLVITGAGMSADSGLPTYRGIGGLYEDELTEDGLPIEVALSGQTMAHRPAVCWKYLRQIESACRGCQPHEGHAALVALEQRVESFCLLTQNIDGLHQLAGSCNVVPIHGDVHTLRCSRCRYRAGVADYSMLAPVPRCPKCDGVVRPDVVLFEEMLPVAAIERLQAFLAAGVDLVMSIGTTSVFPYIAGPVVDAARAGICTVEINPGESAVSGVVRHRLEARALDVLPALVSMM